VGNANPTRKESKMKFDRILFNCFAVVFASLLVFAVVVMPERDPLFAAIIAFNSLFFMLVSGFIASRCD